MDQHVKSLDKSLKQSNKSIIGYKIIILICVVIFFFFWNIITGKVSIESLISQRRDYYQQDFYTEILKRIYEAKDYIITLLLVGVAVYFLKKSNREWEEKYNRELKGKKKTGELSVVEEDKEEEEEEEEEEN